MATNATTVPAGTLIRFDCDGKSHNGYVTGRDTIYPHMLRVCTAPGKYFWVDTYEIV
ncbi:hypothetical protein SEA_EVANESCE_2 [Mycobacterium phage Evanesce]|uniref:Uncharacterized protein n=15 Tax=Caudoviricetes TaxID=2731619 RepID=A0A385D1Q7_9CAUD|nr:hypothetical protein Giles_2 [Mycobacterium phage Giles]AHY84187.1 hypothetical protein PBI_HH92_2 [Mycobacterium phage HH92]AKQ07778.1 hypothetical protein SEA_KINBOTE_2 [Mycobacterium phage Kinbote]ALA06646.1 hypothetical protein SEA_OBUpride_2 [Mycobacterium phage OBUpride]ALF00223.1 hypothetical protein SEA_EVANESCE_2 [Mycobacterium phage Evanesce]ATN90410.1 hypothetical protein SEA_LILHAZELNUT_2 [Mycobacterium phage LilHazelnut]AXQ51434.1 hypothetical protein SEA_AMOCHICK_2 [Mycobacte